jgi:hypothetical protein
VHAEWDVTDEFYGEEIMEAPREEEGVAPSVRAKVVVEEAAKVRATRGKPQSAATQMGSWGPAPPSTTTTGGATTSRAGVDGDHVRHRRHRRRDLRAFGNITETLGAVASKLVALVSPELGTTESGEAAEDARVAELLIREDPVPLSAVHRDIGLVELIAKSLASEKKYKFEMGDTNEVGFYMLRDAASAFMNELEALRSRPPKFICINDDLNATAPDPYVMRELMDLLHTLYPARSPFELPLGPVGTDGRRREVGGFASVLEWDAELRSRAGSRAGKWLMLFAAVFAAVTLRRVGDDVVGSVQHFRRLRRGRLRKKEQYINI